MSNDKGNGKKIIDFLKKHKEICIIALVTIIIILAILIINYVKTDDTYRIAKNIVKIFDNEYSNITLVTKSCNGEFSCDKATLIYIDSIGKKEDEKFAVAVARYNSHAEALGKQKHFADYNKMIHNKFDDKVISNANNYDDFFYDNTVLVEGNYLFSINQKVKYQPSIVKYIKGISKKYNTKDIKEVDNDKLSKYWDDRLNEYSNYYDDIYANYLADTKSLINDYINKLDGCVNDQCDKLLENILVFEKYSDLSEVIENGKNKYNEVISAKKENINLINTSINEVKYSLDKEKFDSIKKQIDELDDTYYEEYKVGWKEQLNSIEESVFKNSCSKYSYKELLRNPSDYIGKNAYFFGKILQKVDYTGYRVGIDCSRYYYLSGYHCDNDIYVTYIGDVNLLEDDMVEIWGTMAGTQSYTSIAGLYITIPELIAKYVKLK